jgi:hypothetical protein
MATGAEDPNEGGRNAAVNFVRVASAERKIKQQAPTAYF